MNRRSPVKVMRGLVGFARESKQGGFEKSPRSKDRQYGAWDGHGCDIRAAYGLPVSRQAAAAAW